MLLFSGGKDSAVLLHLAVKAFAPALIPFPVMHIDTGHNFSEVIEYRDRQSEAAGARLVIASVQASIDAGRAMDPARGSRETASSPTPCSTPSTSTGSTRPSAAPAATRTKRAPKSGCSASGRVWPLGPTSPAPARRQLYQGRVNHGEHLRAFPLSDWTELDIWQYIERERIELPPIYFAHEREVVHRDGMLLAVSQWVAPTGDEVAERLMVRYRTVGDATLTGAVRSTAVTVAEIIEEISTARVSERGATRGDDRFSETAMEDRKREGYF